MAEAAILSNQREATRLYQRGVAAARSGQRRVAAGLLQRAVQLDPQHEGAWLWLSGVLDDPQEAAFCLRSVLALNPANDHARAGLAWLEQRQAAKTVAAPTLEPPATSTASQRLPVVDADEPARERNARHHGESWWVNWRSSRRAMSRARIVMWLVPILLLGLTLAWRQSVELTVARIQSNLRPTVVVPTALPVVAEEAALVPGALPPSRPRASDDAALLAYLSQIEPLREQLRGAVEEYRQTIRQPGLSSITHAASARHLRDKVANAHTTMSAMQPPRIVADLHQEYVDGLTTELGALDDLLAFYGEYNVGLANRAALRFQESSARFNRVQAGFDQHLGRISRAASGPPPHAPR